MDEKKREKDVWNFVWDQKFPANKKEENTHLQSFLPLHVNARVVLREIRETRVDGALQGALFDRPGANPIRKQNTVDPLEIIES